MSRSKEKKAKELAAEKKSRKQTVTMAIIIAVIVVALLLTALVINSSAIKRKATAVTVGDMKFSIVDFNYFYYSAYYQYVTDVYSQYPAYAETFLPDMSQSLRAQIVDTDTGETWDDRFVKSTLDQLLDIGAVYQAGQKAGYVLSDERAHQLDETYEAAEAQAELSNVSLNKLLSRNYGKGITGEDYKRLMYISAYAEEYEQYIQDGFTYTQEQITSYYEENKDRLDVYGIRSFYISQNDFPDGMTGAKAAADAYAADIHSEQDMIDAARDYNADTYGEDDSTLHYYAGSSLASQYYDWAVDPARQNGDVYVAENSVNNAYYVVYFLERSQNEYPIAQLHMITMYPDSVSASDYETTEAYNAAQETAKADLKAEAEEILRQWNAADEKNLDTFQVLYDDHTDDYYYLNGLVECYYKHLYTPEMDAWVYDSARKEGDAAVFVTPDDQIAYFVRFDQLGENYCDYLGRDGLSTADFLAWDASIKEGLTAEKGTLFSLR